MKLKILAYLNSKPKGATLDEIAAALGTTEQIRRQVLRAVNILKLEHRIWMQKGKWVITSRGGKSHG